MDILYSQRRVRSLLENWLVWILHGSQRIKSYHVYKKPTDPAVEPAWAKIMASYVFQSDESLHMLWKTIVLSIHSNSLTASFCCSQRFMYLLFQVLNYASGSSWNITLAFSNLQGRASHGTLVHLLVYKMKASLLASNILVLKSSSSNALTHSALYWGRWIKKAEATTSGPPICMIIRYSCRAPKTRVFLPWLQATASTVLKFTLPSAFKRTISSANFCWTDTVSYPCTQTGRKWLTRAKKSRWMRSLTSPSKLSWGCVTWCNFVPAVCWSHANLQNWWNW